MTTLTIQQPMTQQQRRTVLSTLWCCLMVLYLYADLLSFYRPGALDKISEGFMGPLAANQQSLLFAAVLMIIPALMIVLAQITKGRVLRVTNIVFAMFYTLVNVANIVGEVWLYYLLFGVVEILVTVTIAFIAIRYKQESDQ